MIRDRAAQGSRGRSWSRFAWFCAGLIALGVLAGRSADARPTRHPTYDDGRTLRWYANFSEAGRTAVREGKLILVDVSPPSSRACGNVIGLIKDPAIRARIARLAVGHHVDSRARSPLLRDFRANLARGSRLPWIGLFTPGGTWVAGFAPQRRTNLAEMKRRFLRALDRGEAMQQRLFPAPPPVAAPRVSSTRERAQAGEKPRASSSRGGEGARRNTPATRKAPQAARSGGTRSASGILWYERISEARAVAKAEGKIILVTSTKSSCSLCKKLRNKVIPQIQGELSKGCVFYVYDITKPESRALDRLVRANLPNARLMPLSGFMTADGRWLHGFFGSTDTRQLLGDYRTAMRKR